ncbi:hypothetical protein G6F59_017475 [Rhizopus arrhizus]|nr:hypothetical protein G6F59_017475 [Rhizopus arrhizus]
MRVELGCLTRQRLHHGGVGVPDHGYVVVGVQIATPRGVVQPHALAAHQFHRFFVEQPVSGTQRLAPRQQVLMRFVAVYCHRMSLVRFVRGVAQFHAGRAQRAPRLHSSYSALNNAVAAARLRRM